MIKLFVPIFVFSVFVCCNMKQDGQLNEEQLKAYFLKKLLKRDSTMEIISFRLESVDTMNEKEKARACIRTYKSYLEFLKFDSTVAIESNEWFDMMTRAFENNTKRYLISRIDSVNRIIPNSDSVAPVAYYAKCSYHIRNYIGSKIDKTWILLDSDRRIVEEDDFYGLTEVINNGMWYSK